jgi:hypothetical protein
VMRSLALLVGNVVLRLGTCVSGENAQCRAV